MNTSKNPSQIKKNLLSYYLTQWSCEKITLYSNIQVGVNWETSGTHSCWHEIFAKSEINNRLIVHNSPFTVHPEYIFQRRNRARNGACRSHWSTTGLILYGWPNKNFELNRFKKFDCISHPNVPIKYFRSTLIVAV
jgi:hypothetical protein